MAKLNFEFAHGILTATGANTFILVSASDYMARTIGDGGDIEIYPTNLDPRLKPFKFHYDDITIMGASATSAAEFVALFNNIAGSQFGFNTKYPEQLFSQHITLDTSVDEQVVPAWVITDHSAGYVTLTAPDGNTGDIYVGEDDVSIQSYHLEPGKSLTLELADLSLIWVQSSAAGDHVNVIGAAKI
jgi:hypothetical protein